MSHLRNTPEIEPLSEVAWRRIERRVFDELDRMSETRAEVAARSRWRRPALAMGGVAVLAAAALLLLLLLPQGGGEAPWQRVTTGESRTQISLDRGVLDVAPGSALRIQDGGERGVVVVLEKGGVHCAVKPDPRKPPFMVKAGDVRVEVVGTRFSVTRWGRSARVVVEDGTVHVFYEDQERAVLEAGDAWPRAPALADGSGASGAAGVDGESTGGAEAAIDAVDDATDDAAGDATDDAADNAAGGIAAEGPPAGMPWDAWAKSQYEKAAGMEAARPDAALAIYRTLARGDGAWAANALFAQGRLELERGDREAALVTLGDYLRRFPDGMNVLDAQALIRGAR